MKIIDKNKQNWQIPLLIGSIFLILSIIIEERINIANIIQILIFSVLIWYAWETKRIREIEQEPIMLLSVGNINKLKYEPFDSFQLRQSDIRDDGYLIRIKTESKDSDYFISLRNTGRGTAFNVVVRSELFDIEKYETNFFAPSSDEYLIKIIEKGNKKIENWGKINGSVFTISSQSINGKIYSFKFKIIDAERQTVKFIE